MGFDELVQHDASELTKGTLPAERLPSEGVDADTLDGVDGSDYARTDQDETVSGKRSFNDDIAVDTDLLFIDVSLERIGVNNSGPQTAFEVNATSTFTTDATVSSDFFLSNKDLPASVGKMGSGIEFGPFGDSTGGKSAAIVPVSRDNSSSHPTALAFFTKASTSSTDPVVEQMRITEQGNVVMANKALIGATGAATNALDVSGGAVVGSGFAGSNTAPTDGLLVEGKMAIGNSSVTTGGLHVETAGGDDLGRFQIQDGGNIYPRSGLFLSNVSGVSGGEMYSLIFDRGSGTRFASITARYEDATGGSEDGRLEIRTRNNGSEREALRLDSQQRTILRQSNNSPGTPSNPIFQIGGGGAGLFVDSNGDVVAVDNSGNTNVLT